ncbi:hypothetical protein EDEG_03480 [Edhazardia aedis USNM 41457]|uniref:Uncharacterized protein n=1 Tax=Edhazardia aedis (strain USNM 41457) TaxID=1003232 RepID=J8ZQX7_EDHAE|nr:hypothetical protein EDEG_03480 [Edhazardia aedis USNM 41457]|eukprot:EJW02078.1 hypothetical protein EDEG_03480 [Edhazardia aedis USNM 41457]
MATFKTLALLERTKNKKSSILSIRVKSLFSFHRLYLYFDHYFFYCYHNCNVLHAIIFLNVSVCSIFSNSPSNFFISSLPKVFCLLLFSLVFLHKRIDIFYSEHSVIHYN